MGKKGGGWGRKFTQKVRGKKQGTVPDENKKECTATCGVGGKVTDPQIKATRGRVMGQEKTLPM